MIWCLITNIRSDYENCWDKMIPTRNAKIVKSAGKVTITTCNLKPKLNQFLFLLGFIPWMALGVFGLMSIGGFVSPETLTPGIRVFLAIWVILWVTGGAYIEWRLFLRAFARVEIIANKTGVKIARVFPFGSTTKSYSWNTIEYISEYLTTGRTYGGVVMRAGRWLTTIDSRLPNSTAEKVSEALLSVVPKK